MNLKVKTYLSKVDFDILASIKSLAKEPALAQISLIDNIEKRTHTEFFYESKLFSKNDIPSYKLHKRPVESIQTPFQRCEATKIKQTCETTSSNPDHSETNFSVTEGDHDEQDSDLNHEAQDPRLIFDLGNDQNADLEPNVEFTVSEDSEENVSIEESQTVVNNVKETNHTSETNFESHAETNTVKELGVSFSNNESINFRKEIESALSSVFTGDLLKDEVNNFVDTLSDKISTKVKSLMETKSDSGDTEPKGDWITTEAHLICKSCIRYAKSDEVPQKLKSLHRGNFGFIERSGTSDGVHRANFHATSAKKKHESNDLHIWCSQKQAEVKASYIDSEVKSRQAGMLVVRNALLCLKRGLSSEDFVSMNDKDNMSENLNTATKNDSAFHFFDIRNVAYEKLLEMIKTIFRHIDSFTVTLDKVTVGRISYTVVLTYFFFEGRIYVILNKLVHLTTKDYDGEGTAKMLLDCLVETTGLPVSVIAVKLKHITYDGVYCEPEEQIRGGGSLSLRTHLEKLLGLSKGSLTGTWDSAHLMQKTFADMIKCHPKVTKAMKLLIDAMKLYHVGKAATLFLSELWN